MSFLRDRRGISEEFTSLPALAIVMIGFAIFISLIAGAYNSYNNNIKAIDGYEKANLILEKMTMDNGILEDKGIIMPGGMINISKFSSLTPRDIYYMMNKCGIGGIEFGFRLELDSKCDGFENVIEKGIDGKYKNAIATSRKIPVYLNDAQVVPGVFTVVVCGD